MTHTKRWPRCFHAASRVKHTSNTRDMLSGLILPRFPSTVHHGFFLEDTGELGFSIMISHHHHSPSIPTRTTRSSSPGTSFLSLSLSWQGIPDSWMVEFVEGRLYVCTHETTSNGVLLIPRRDLEVRRRTDTTGVVHHEYRSLRLSRASTSVPSASIPGAVTRCLPRPPANISALHDGRKGVVLAAQSRISWDKTNLNLHLPLLTQSYREQCK